MPASGSTDQRDTHTKGVAGGGPVLLSGRSCFLVVVLARCRPATQAGVSTYALLHASLPGSAAHSWVCVGGSFGLAQPKLAVALTLPQRAVLTEQRQCWRATTQPPSHLARCCACADVGVTVFENPLVMTRALWVSTESANRGQQAEDRLLSVGVGAPCLLACGPAVKERPACLCLDSAMTCLPLYQVSVPYPFDLCLWVVNGPVRLSADCARQIKRNHSSRRQTAALCVDQGCGWSSKTPFRFE